MGTKPLGSGAVDPATAGPRKGRHRLPGGKCRQMGVGILGLSRKRQPNSPTAQQKAGSIGRPVSWLPVLKRILLLFWLLKTNPVTE
jgi:hypothetical protein